MVRNAHRDGGDINTKLGIRLLLLTGVRTIELRSATPEQFKLNLGLWIIPCITVKQLQVRQRKARREVPPYRDPRRQSAHGGNLLGNDTLEEE
jgi:integrase